MTGVWNEAILREWSADLGFAKASLCPAEGFEDVRQAVKSQPPIAERRQLRFEPVRDDPRTSSLAVLLWPYRPARVEAAGCVFIDSYYDASNAAYHAAQDLERRAAEAGGFARANTPYPAREAAVRAGLGRIGRNGLLITPEFGTRVVIVLMATDLPAPASEDSARRLDCEGCGRCAAVCPAHALDASGMRHPERCLRNFMMEGVVAPVELRGKMGMRLIGCDLCQRVCPMQPDLPPDEREGLPLSQLMTDDEAAFTACVSSLAERIGRNMARPQRVRAQAALLAGNLRDPAHLDVLHEWAKSPFEAVRAHALWAIERIEGDKPPHKWA